MTDDVFGLVLQVLCMLAFLGAGLGVGGSSCMALYVYVVYASAPLFGLRGLHWAGGGGGGEA